jgi:GNAT superfamily N-acetyltransferase
MNITTTLPSRSVAAERSRETIEIVRPQPEHINELARICYEAFGQLHEHHAVIRDFPDLAFAQQVVGLFATRPEIYGVAALVDGQPAGSNYLSLFDDVSGVGPITIDPEQQGKGIGRKLMQAVIDEAERRGIRQVRLVQEAVNITSGPLYASLGFEVREPLAFMTLKAAAKSDPTVRPFRAEDWPAIDELCRRQNKVSRLNELKFWTSLHIPLFVREKHGRLRGYFLPGKLGHTAAETATDALALFGEAARCVPADLAICLCPMRQTDLYQGALHAGHRVAKVLTLMTRGPYAAPEGAWTASYLY